MEGKGNVKRSYFSHWESGQGRLLWNSAIWMKTRRSDGVSKRTLHVSKRRWFQGSVSARVAVNQHESDESSECGRRIACDIRTHRGHSGHCWDSGFIMSDREHGRVLSNRVILSVICFSIMILAAILRLEHRGQGERQRWGNFDN